MSKLISRPAEAVVSSLGVDLFSGDDPRREDYLSMGYNVLGPEETVRKRAHSLGLLASVAETRGRKDRLEQLGDKIAAYRARLGMIANFESFTARLRDGTEEREGFRIEDHQVEVWEDFAEFMRTAEVDPEGGVSGYIVKPTGSGKTVIFSKIIEELHRQEEIEGQQTLIIVPTTDILRQTIGSDGKGLLKRRRGIKGFTDLDVTPYYGKTKDDSGEVVVTTYKSLLLMEERGLLANGRFKNIIYDEAHNTLGEKTLAAVNRLKKGRRMFGFTASPDYGGERNISKVFENLIHKQSLREAIKEGALAPLRVFLYKTDYEIDIDLKNQKDYTSEELGALASLEARNRSGVALAKEFIEQGMQGLISCVPGEDVLHPKIMAEMLAGAEVIDSETQEIRAITAAAVDGNMNMADRERIYEQYENGEIDVLCYVDLLGEGWDSRAAKFLINLRPTTSKVFGLQRLGRILRRVEDSIAIAVDFVDVTSKSQVTALHILNEFAYHPGHVFGRFFTKKDSEKEKEDKSHIRLPEELKKAITVSEGRVVKEMFLATEYEAEFSQSIPITDIAAQLRVIPEVIYRMAPMLGIPMVVHEWPDKTRQIKINEIHIADIKNNLRASRFKHLNDLDVSPERVEEFFGNLLEGKDPEEINPILEKIFEEGDAPEGLLRFMPKDARLSKAMRPRKVVAAKPDVKTKNRNADLGHPSASYDQADKLSISQLSGMIFFSRDQMNQNLRIALQRVSDRSFEAGDIWNTINARYQNAEVAYQEGHNLKGYSCRVIVKLSGEEVVNTHVAEATPEAAKRLARYHAIFDFLNLDAAGLGMQPNFDVAKPKPVPVERKETRTLVSDDPVSALYELCKGDDFRDNSIHFSYFDMRVAGGWSVFEATVNITTIEGVRVTASAEGRSKKIAKKLAANEMLIQLKNLPSKPVEQIPKKVNKEKITFKGEQYKVPKDAHAMYNFWNQLTGVEMEIAFEPDAIGKRVTCTILTVDVDGEEPIIFTGRNSSSSEAKKNALASLKKHILKEAGV